MTSSQFEDNTEHPSLDLPNEKVMDYETLLGDHYDPEADQVEMAQLATEVMADLVRYKWSDVKEHRDV